MRAKRRDQHQQTKTRQASRRELIGRDGIQLSPTKSDQQTTGLSALEEEDTRTAQPSFSSSSNILLTLPPPPLPLRLYCFVLSAHRLIKRILIRGFESKKLFSIISLFLSYPSKMFSHKTTLLCFQDVTEPYNGKLKKNQSH